MTDGDTVVLELTIDKLRYIVVSMYMDIVEQMEKDLHKIDKILEFERGVGIIIAADTNSRSTTWHDKQTNKRGRKLEEYISSKNLYIMNEESEMTTYKSRRGSSNVDLTIINNLLITACSGWEISKEESCSDHNIINFCIAQGNPNRNASNFNGIRYIVNEGNLRKFDKNLLHWIEKEFSQIRNGEPEAFDKLMSSRLKDETDIENIAGNFQKALKSACDTSFPKKLPTDRSTKKKSVPWWTEELTIRRKRINALRRRYQRTKNNDELRESRKSQYYEEKTKYQVLIKKQKINSWKQYCNMTTTPNPWNLVYKLASGKMKNTVALTTLRKPDGSLTSSLDETTQYMLEYLVPEDNVEGETDHHKFLRATTEKPIQTPDDRDFTQEEIQQIIKEMDNKKAPGEDGITSLILLRAFKIFPRLITTIYNGCLRTGCFPKIWKRAKLIPIVKPGKENSAEVSKFRPISLINIGGKILEKALINRIMHHLHTNNLLNQNQFGFTPQKNTTDAVTALKEYVEDELDTGQIIVLVSLDVKGAFDAAWWPSILNALKEFKCPRNLYNVTKSYFSQRIVTMATRNGSLEREATKGCPQGSCCGPGFWNIQYNSLLNLEYTNRTRTIAFADDFILAVKGETRSEAENFTNLEMSKVATWAKEHKILFNEEKSKVMVISRRKRREERNVKIYLNNRLLEQVNTMKYLGIILDSKFTFKEHIKYAAERCSKLIHTLSKSAKLNWGLNHEALKTMYKGAILPLLLYGAPVWAKAMKHACNRLIYTRVQRLINIKIAKAFRTTSSEALCILTGLTPIIIKVEEAAKLYDLTKGKGIQSNIDGKVEPKNWSHPADTVRLLETEGHKEVTMQIYTDGSKSEHGVGSGVAIFTGNELTKQLTFKLDDRCSNNQAEQLAIVKALEEIERTTQIPRNQRTAIIYTDSRITIDSLTNSRTHNRLIEEIRKKVTILERLSWTINLSWIKAHVGIHGNELADRLAKEAARNQEAIISYYKIPKSTIVSELKEEGKEKWQQEWDKTTKGRATKSFFPSVNQRLKIKMNLTPNFTAIVTGHGKTKSYLNRFKIIDNPTCPCNSADQTTEHLIYDCRLLQRERQTLKNNVLKTGNWPATQEELIKTHRKHFIHFTESIDFEKL